MAEDFKEVPAPQHSTPQKAMFKCPECGKIITVANMEIKISYEAEPANVTFQVMRMPAVRFICDDCSVAFVHADSSKIVKPENKLILPK